MDDSRAGITHSAVSYDKDGNAYYIRSVLEVPNAMERATPQPWACAEILRSANVRSLRALWKSRLVRLRFLDTSGAADVTHRSIVCRAQALSERASQAEPQ